jgi:hypothetical protein
MRQRTHFIALVAAVLVAAAGIVSARLFFRSNGGMGEIQHRYAFRRGH